MSRKYGTDVLINPRIENAAEGVRKVTEGGSDVVVEAAGRRETVEYTSMLVRPAGRVALVGEFSGFMKFGAAGEATLFSIWLTLWNIPLH